MTEARHAPDNEPRQHVRREFRYARIHIPSGSRTSGKQSFLRRLDFLEALNRWNSAGTEWHYFEEAA
ncbi:MAG TPA: hypothetical protein VEF36_01345 [Roseiarcus sp.]|nr:hypothetical protein [Roseiarcus sp.]